MGKKIKEVFNPVKEEKDGVKAKQIIWSTKSLDAAIIGIEQGKKLIANPFYENNVKLLKGDMVFQRTPDEIKEWLKCKNDIIYFAEKYCKLMTPEGIQHIHLRDYQIKYLKHLTSSQLSIYLACRQCSKTTMSSVYLLHYICFNVDKTALCTGNKRRTAVEILDKIKKIFFELPYFLKPGIYKWNEAEIAFDNGCRVMAEATTLNTGIGFTINLLLLDEFAHLPENIVEKFYNNIFPTIVAAKAKLMITSTQNGYNLFYRLYKAAEAGENDYKPFKTDWYEVPEWNPEKKCWEKRDEAWRQKQIANYGSEEAFNSQFGTDFDVSANTLINKRKLDKKKQQVVEFEEKDLLGVTYSNKYFWLPDYNPMDQLKNDYIIITCDLAEGGGGDYTVFAFYKLIGDNKLQCVGYFRSNELLREDCTYSLQTLMCKYMNMDKLLLSYEYNTYGELFYRDLTDNSEKDRFISKIFDQSIIVKYYNESKTRFTQGIKLTSGNKSSHCLLFKESFERDNIINDSTKFLSELLSFTDDGSGHYKASFGHDDMVMTAVQIEFVKSTLQYKIFNGNYIDSILMPQNKDDLFNPFEILPWSIEDNLYDYNETLNINEKRLRMF